MADIPIEIRWSDDDERQHALKVLEDVNGRVTRDELQGIIEAEISSDVGTVLRDRNVSFSIPMQVEKQGEALAAVEIDDLFPKRVSVSQLTNETKNMIQEFSQEAMRIGMTRAGDAFVVRKEPRKRSMPQIDGLNLDVDAMVRSATEVLLPDSQQILPQDAYLVRLTGPLEATWRTQLETIAPLGDHRPPDIFRMILTPEQLATVQELPFVKAAKRYGILDTLTSSMVKKLEEIKSPVGGLEGIARAANPVVSQFDLTVHYPEMLSQVEALIENTTGVQVVSTGHASLRFEARVNSPILAVIAQLPLVRSLAPYEAPKLFLDQARLLLGLDAISPPQPAKPNGPWDGDGELAAVFDSGIDPNHSDIVPALGDRQPRSYDAGVAVDAIGHGTHVAGIIAGRGIASNGAVRGVAPAAMIDSISIVNSAGDLIIPVDLGDMLKLAVAAGASVINLSWGKKLRFEYDVYGESIDRFVWANPNILVVVAAGNEGVAEREQGPKLGRHRPRTIGMPAAAKNVLTVGASCNQRQGYPATWGQVDNSDFPDPPASQEPVVAELPFPAAISSRGPSGFDSIKPDLLAPGTMVLSAKAAGSSISFVDHALPASLNGSAQYGYLNGTSMAAPMVAGAALLLRQFLRVERSTPQPSAALLKTLLIVSARKIANASVNSMLSASTVGFPDFDQGFGVMDLRNILDHEAAPADRKLAFHDLPNTDVMALEARVESNSTKRSFRTYKLEVPEDSTTMLRIAMGWTDAPGRGVQNLLSLEVKDPDSKPKPGNHDRRMFVDELAVAMGATPFDKLNTTQVVIFENPRKGTYRVTVRAESTTVPPQGYALVACGPLKDESLQPLF